MGRGSGRQPIMAMLGDAKRGRLERDALGMARARQRRSEVESTTHFLAFVAIRLASAVPVLRLIERGALSISTPSWWCGCPGRAFAQSTSTQRCANAWRAEWESPMTARKSLFRLRHRKRVESGLVVGKEQSYPLFGLP
jgi:hypothetical protein